MIIECQFLISRITTSTGEDISGTRLGEKLFLRIEMDQESIFGIFARNLKAISGDNEDEIELLLADEFGNKMVFDKTDI